MKSISTINAAITENTECSIIKTCAPASNLKMGLQLDHGKSLCRGSLEGFLRFPKTTQDFPLTMGASLFSYKVSRGIHSKLNGGVTGFCFDLKLRKCSEYFFWSSRRKIGDLCKNLCCSVTGNSARRSRNAKVCDKQAVWKLLSKISRTAPAMLLFASSYSNF